MSDPTQSARKTTTRRHLAEERVERRRLKLDRRRKAARSPYEDYIAGFDDPVDRARARMECGVEPQFGELMSPLEAAIHGRTAAERYGHDSKLLKHCEAKEKCDLAMQGALVASDELALEHKARHMSQAECLTVINRARLAMLKYDCCLTSMLTVKYADLDSSKRAEYLGAFLNQCLKRLEQRGHVGYKFHHLYVHENARDTGFHTHVLFELPKPKRLHDAQGRTNLLTEDFRAWANTTWSMKLGLDPASEPAYLSPKNPTGDASRAAQQWFWVRYICKALDPGLTTTNTSSGQPLRTFMKLPHNNAYGPMEVPRVRTSRSLSPKSMMSAREELAFEPYSSLADLPTFWDNGRELQDGRIARAFGALDV